MLDLFTMYRGIFSKSIVWRCVIQITVWSFW